jgi:hypothetical protein
MDGGGPHIHALLQQKCHCLYLGTQTARALKTRAAPSCLLAVCLAAAVCLGDAIMHLKALGFDNDEIRHRVVAYCPQVCSTSYTGLVAGAAEWCTLLAFAQQSICQSASAAGPARLHCFGVMCQLGLQRAAAAQVSVRQLSALLYSTLLNARHAGAPTALLG